MKSLVEYWTKIFKWHATATRAQYLIPTLVYNILYGIIFVMTGETITNGASVHLTNNNPIIVLIGLVLVIAQFTLSARRLQGSNRSAGLVFLGFIPFFGTITVFILCLLNDKPNKANPAEPLKNQSEA
ncbi:DUF805 domain-containing protein [Paucilactobacillus sp. N302-9]